MLGLKRYIIIVAFLIFVSHSHVDALSTNFCGNAVDEDLCENMVKGTKNWDDAITKAVSEATKEVVRASKAGNSVCEKPYKHAEKKLMDSLENVRDGDKDNNLNLQLQEALASLQDCTKELKNLKQDDISADKALIHGVEQAIRVCLTVESSKSDSSSKSAVSDTATYSLIE